MNSSHLVRVVSQATVKTEGVPAFEDSSDGTYAVGRVPGRFQVSRRFKKEYPTEPDRRYAYEVFDSEDDIVFSSEDGWETVLRETSTRQQLKAIFFETNRHVSSLAFQRFNANGKPIQNRQTLLLNGNEVRVLRDFLTRIELVDLVGEEGV